MLRDLIKQIFNEECMVAGNYLIKSRFWIRKQVIGGCYSGDEYSEPNIDEIVKAIEEVNKKII